MHSCGALHELRTVVHFLGERDVVISILLAINRRPKCLFAQQVKISSWPGALPVPSARAPEIQGTLMSQSTGSSPERPAAKDPSINMADARSPARSRHRHQAASACHRIPDTGSRQMGAVPFALASSCGCPREARRGYDAQPSRAGPLA
jgi:hypothetical protein